MKKKDKQKENMTQPSEAALLSLVAEALKGKVLFPEMLADVREHERKLRLSKK